MKLAAKYLTSFTEKDIYKRHGGDNVGCEAGFRPGVISNVQHGKPIGVNSMTKLLSLPEELISWEFDGQAIIATGFLLTSLGQVAGCRAEYQQTS